MPLTASEIDQIESDLIQAFADRKGAKSITFSDQSVTFDSWDEARKFIADLRAATGPSRTRYAATSKGI